MNTLDALLFLEIVSVVTSVLLERKVFGAYDCGHLTALVRRRHASQPQRNVIWTESKLALDLTWL